MIPVINKVKVGRYRVQEGDTSASIAKKLYGDVHKAPQIMNANGYDWGEGDIIDVPGFTGFTLVSQKGEQFTRLYRRAFSTTTAAAQAKDNFFKWNGQAEIPTGTEVFFVDRMKKSWGY